MDEIGGSGNTEWASVVDVIQPCVKLVVRFKSQAVNFIRCNFNAEWFLIGALDSDDIAEVDSCLWSRSGLNNKESELRVYTPLQHLHHSCKRL